MRPVSAEPDDSVDSRRTFSFGTLSLFYVIALFASAMALWGGCGVVVAGVVLAFWMRVLYSPKGITLGWLLALLLLCAIVIFVLVPLFLPAIAYSRYAASRNVCANQLRQVSLAMLNYATKHGSLPPAYLPDKEGEPMHSWRVLILPFLEESALYEAYDFSEPWDGPNNRKLAKAIPDVFRCPSHDDTTGRPSHYHTSYFVVTDPASAFPGDGKTKLAQIADGASQTLMLIEASGLGIDWMEPRDLSLEEAATLLTRPGSGHLHKRDSFFKTDFYEMSSRNVVYVDGRVEYIGQLGDAQVAEALITIAGGEKLTPEMLEDVSGEPVFLKTVVKWGRVYAFGLFVLLVILPGVVRYFRRRRLIVS
jgi:hypothetical protein